MWRKDSIKNCFENFYPLLLQLLILKKYFIPDMKKTAAFILALLLFNCSQDDQRENCNSENPFEMKWITEWIAELQNCACTVSIFQAEYEEENVFWQLMTDPLCQGVMGNVSIHNCDGNEFLVLESSDHLAEFQKKVSGMKIIYQCPTIRD